MSYYPLPRLLRIVALLSALLLIAGGARAEVFLLFPNFDVLNGMQTVRLNAVLIGPEGDQTCPVSLAFLDSEGAMVGNSSDFELRGGVAVHIDFADNPSRKQRERLSLRARVKIVDPELYPSCRAGILASIEIMDKGTGATQIVLTNPIKWEPPTPGTVDLGIMFLPSGATTAMSCSDASVSNVRFEVFDNAGSLRTEVVRPCVPDERYRVTLDAGPYTIRAQGLQSSTVCYENNQSVTILAGQTQTLSNIIAFQHPNGAAQGCTYPSSPSPR